MILASGFVAKEFESVSGQLLHYYFPYFSLSLVSSCSGDIILLLVVVVNVVTFSSFSVNKSKEKL
jgi:uncharacterized membrane protein YdcZ (DUF606 family)